MLKLSGSFIWLLLSIMLVFLPACTALNVLPPEVNLMRVEVREATLSHVNLLADLRVFNPNDRTVTIQGVEYTLHIEGVRIFSGKSYQRLAVAPQEYGRFALRLSSAYWDIIQLFNKLPEKSDVAFEMQGSILVGGSRLAARRFGFEKQGIIPFQNLNR